MFHPGRPTPPRLTERERRRRVHRPRQVSASEPTSATATTTPTPTPTPTVSPSSTRSLLFPGARIIVVLADGRRIEVVKPQTKPPPIKPWTSLFSLPTWNLIPKEKFTFVGNYYLFNFTYYGFTDQYCRLHLKQCPFKHSSLAAQHQWAIQQKEVEEKYTLNQKLRWAFKTLATAWLTKKLQFKNTTDFATLEVPKQEVVLYDWAQRSTYRFEAASILRDFRTRLLSHEELFPMPLSLRNPFTNAQLSKSQIHSMYMQMKQYGKTHWTMECFRDASYDMYYFARDNQRKLRLTALKHLLETRECRYILMDFIESQHLLLNRHCDVNLYEWAIGSTKAATMKRIQSWKEMCYKYYEIDITSDDADDKAIKQHHLSRFVEPLCSPCEELRMVRQLCRNKRREA